jgi:hypothetical protein
MRPIDMEVCYWALLYMPLVILHHLLNVSVQLANKSGFKQKKNSIGFSLLHRKHIMSPQRAQQANVIYRFVTMVY